MLTFVPAKAHKKMEQSETDTLESDDLNLWPAPY